MKSTVSGMQIEFSKLPEKLPLAIRFNRELVWNVIASSCLQRQKHDLPRISTLRGMQIVFNELS
jgi:hypothetical protein